MTVSIEGERNLNDAGQNRLMALWDKLAEDNLSEIKIVNLLNGETWGGCFLVNISKIGGGATTELSTFAVDFQSNGKPTYIKGTSDAEKITRASNLLNASTFKVPVSAGKTKDEILAFIKPLVLIEIKKIDENTVYLDTSATIDAGDIPAASGDNVKITTLSLTLNTAVNAETKTNTLFIDDARKGKN